VATCSAGPPTSVGSAVLDAARGVLEREGVVVAGVASSGDEAPRRVEDLRPDVTLVDIDLGGESGFDVVRLLHHGAGVTPSRLIFISAHAEDDYAELIAASPVAGFLPKTALSAGAIRDLLGRQEDGGPVSGVERRDHGHAVAASAGLEP
jgi:DNA-binding NarL/FixJ family response regulator